MRRVGMGVRALRRRRADLAVIYMSGYGDSEGQDREPGVFLAKPFTAVQLAEALQRSLQQAPGRGASHPVEPRADLA